MMSANGSLKWFRKNVYDWSEKNVYDWKGQIWQQVNYQSIGMNMILKFFTLILQLHCNLKLFQN